MLRKEFDRTKNYGRINTTHLILNLLSACCLVGGCKFFEPDSCGTGASAQCSDGTFSYSTNRSGTCSSHGGVAMWCEEERRQDTHAPVITYCWNGICEINRNSGAVCGDGIVNGDEECDDGNSEDGDECYDCLMWNDPCSPLGGPALLLNSGGACGTFRGYNGEGEGQRGDTLWYCDDNGEVQSFDCTELTGNNESCGWNDSINMFDCLGT